MPGKKEDMPEVFFDIGKMASLLGDVAAESADQHAALTAQRPAYAASDAGRDFGSHGERIAASLNELHRRAMVRVATMGDTARAAALQFTIVEATDTESDNRLSAIDPMRAVGR